MSMIPFQFRNAVVAIGERTNQSKESWFASGFIVGKKLADNSGRSNVFLITNKHVVEGRTGVILRFNKQGGGVADKIVTLMQNGQRLYSCHPNPQVDIVACELLGGIIEKSNLQFDWFDLDDHSLTLKEMQSTGVDEGCIVYAIGFPMGIVAEEIKAPFVRMGCISRIEDAFNNIGDSSFYVDAQTFPGNSGGPIVSRPEIIGVGNTKFNSKANLVGVLNSYRPYRDILMSRQTGEPVMVHRENSGLTRVFPVDRIKEVVDVELARFSSQRQQQVMKASNK